MSRSLFNRIVIFCVIFFLILVAPQEINRPNQGVIRAVCTGLAIDKAEDDTNSLDVNAQVLIPKAGGQYSQTMSLVNGKGTNLMESFYNMEFQLGKKVRLAHCCFIIISKDASEEDLTSTLDYLVRGNNSGNNIVLVYTDGKAKDLIGVASNVNSNEVDNIQTLVKYNEHFLTSNEASLKSFFADYNSPHKTSIMSCVNLSKQSSSGEQGSSGASGGGSGGGSGGSAEASSGGEQNNLPDKIKNDGSFAVFYNGKLAKVINADEHRYFNWLDKELDNNLVKIENITDENFDNATISYTIIDKNMKQKFYFVNNTPCISIDYTLKLRTESIEQEGGNSPPNQSYINSVIIDAFNEKVEQETQKAMNIQKEYGFDIFNYYKEFNSKSHTEWQKYLNSLDTDNYMKNIQIFTKVTCESMI